MALKYPKRLTTAMVGILLAGCASGPHSSADAPGVVLMPDRRVTLDSAVVQLDRGSVELSGAVHLQGSVGSLSGRVDVEFVGPDGEVLDGLPVGLSPRELTTSKPSTFHLLYGYIPPKGSTIRIHFVDAKTEAEEDMGGGLYDAGLDSTGGTGGGGAANGGGHGTAAHTGGSQNHYSNGHTRGFGNHLGGGSFAPRGGR